jgi:hypothetical protein
MVALAARMKPPRRLRPYSTSYGGIRERRSRRKGSMRATDSGYSANLIRSLRVTVTFSVSAAGPPPAR